jgi:hypothetical protein
MLVKGKIWHSCSDKKMNRESGYLVPVKIRLRRGQVITRRDGWRGGKIPPPPRLLPLQYLELVGEHHDPTSLPLVEPV